MVRKSRIFALVIGASIASVANAQVAFTSFAPGDLYLSGGYNSGHNLSTTNWRQTFRFQSGLTGQLASLKFAVSHRGGDADFVVRLRQDNLGQPGTPFVRFDLSDATPDPGHVVTVNAGAGAPTLNAGEFYWFEFFTDSPTAFHRFHRTTTTLTLPWRASNNGDEIWENSGTVSAPAFEVSVAPVPEPATVLALGAGLAALVRRRRRAA